jgi:hypothetical protein
MQQMPSRPTVAEETDSPVAREAAEVVARAIRAADAHARLAAARCGCSMCRARATTTRLWALAMIHRPLPAAPEAEAA